MKNIRKILAIAFMAILGGASVNAAQSASAVKKATSTRSAAESINPEKAQKAAQEILREALAQKKAAATKATTPKATTETKETVKKVVDLKTKSTTIGRYLLIGSTVVATATLAVVAGLVSFYVKNNTNLSVSDFFGWIGRGCHAIKAPHLKSYINYIDNKCTAFDAFYGPNKMSPVPVVTPMPVINAETHDEIAQEFAINCDHEHHFKPFADCEKSAAKCIEANIQDKCEAELNNHAAKICEQDGCYPKPEGDKALTCDNNNCYEINTINAHNKNVNAHNKKINEQIQKINELNKKMPTKYAIQLPLEEISPVALPTCPAKLPKTCSQTIPTKQIECVIQLPHEAISQNDRVCTIKHLLDEDRKISLKTKAVCPNPNYKAPKCKPKNVDITKIYDEPTIAYNETMPIKILTDFPIFDKVSAIDPVQSIVKAPTSPKKIAKSVDLTTIYLQEKCANPNYKPKTWKQKLNESWENTKKTWGPKIKESWKKAKNGFWKTFGFNQNTTK